jgi:hypothetical protein
MPPPGGPGRRSERRPSPDAALDVEARQGHRAVMVEWLLALALAAAPDCGLPPLAGPPPFEPGEVLTMELGLLGAVRVGEARFSVSRPISGGAVLPLTASVRNTARFGNLQRMVAVGSAWVDARTLRPERYREESDEDGRRRSTDVRLRPAGPRVLLTQSDGTRSSETAFERQGEVLDALTALYYFRAARLVPGARLCFDMVGNGKYWRVEGTVANAPEPVEVPAGRFQAWRLTGTARRADGPGQSRPLWLWVSTDARHLPLAAVSEVDLGPVSAKLTEVRGARKP